ASIPRNAWQHEKNSRRPRGRWPSVRDRRGGDFWLAQSFLQRRRGEVQSTRPRRQRRTMQTCEKRARATPRTGRSLSRLGIANNYAIPRGEKMKKRRNPSKEAA